MLPVTAQEGEPDLSTASGLLDHAYSSMVKGDIQRDNGNPKAAMDAYRTALSGFIRASQKYPELDPEVVRFRMTYCDNQIETLMKNDGINGSRNPSTPEERDKMAPAHIQTAGANADAVSLQLRSIRKQISQRELTEARKALIVLLKQTPDDPEVRTLMGIVQCMLGRFDDADNIITTLLKERPDLRRAYAVLATAKLGLGKIKEAKQALEKAIDMGTSSPEIYYNMTQIILATEPIDAAAARENYKKSLRLGGRPDPDLDYLLKKQH